MNRPSAIRAVRHFIILLPVLMLSSCGVSRYAANARFPEVDIRVGYEGVLEECMYDCSSEGPRQRRMYVYLPKGYHASGCRYPVLYLLHGARGNELSWINKGNVLHAIDTLTSSSRMPATIVVFPNMNQYWDEMDFGRSRLKSAIESLFEIDGAVETAFVRDVVETVDSLYRTVPDKEHRAIAGLSIGAMQSMYISANFPDSFGYVGLFSSMVHPPLKKSLYSSFYKDLKTKMRRQFTSPPFTYSIMIGKKDIFYPQMVRFSRYLERNGYPFDMYLTEGGHQWDSWKEYSNVFMQKIWNR